MTKVLDQVKTDRYSVYHGDTFEVSKSLPDRSVGLSVYSPPFLDLYTYSASDRDLGNCRSADDFWQHYDYLIRETARVMMAGRLVCIHCMDMPTSKQRDGVIGVKDFPGDIIRAFQKHGFVFHSRLAIWKCPVTAMTRTKALGLLYKQLKKDSARCRQGMLDYIVVMRAPGANEDAVTKDPEAFPVAMWQRYASPVWVTIDGIDDEGMGVCSDRVVHDDDSSGIDQQDTLQYRSAREHADERHLCALQLPVIRRCVKLWSNPNDVVWSPFMGIGSEGVVALEMGRRFIGTELKASYYRQACLNLDAAEKSLSGGLFNRESS